MTQLFSDSSPREGQSLFGQRCMTSPSGLTMSTPHRVLLRHPERLRPLRVRQHRADDLRDHVAGALDDDRVALADVLAVDVLLVVEVAWRR